MVSDNLGSPCISDKSRKVNYLHAKMGLQCLGQNVLKATVQGSNIPDMGLSVPLGVQGLVVHFCIWTNGPQRLRAGSAGANPLIPREPNARDSSRKGELLGQSGGLCTGNPNLGASNSARPILLSFYVSVCPSIKKRNEQCTHILASCPTKKTWAWVVHLAWVIEIWVVTLIPKLTVDCQEAIVGFFAV